MKSLCLSFSSFAEKINRNQLEVVVEATYGLRPSKYFETMSQSFGGRSLMTKRFGFHLNSRGPDEIRDSPISIGFCT